MSEMRRSAEFVPFFPSLNSLTFKSDYCPFSPYNVTPKANTFKVLRIKEMITI